MLKHKLKYYLRNLLGGVILLGTPLLTHAQLTDAPTSVLFVGNSYTHYNNMPEIFQKIADSKGDKVIVKMDAKSNHSFEMHSKRSELYQSIKERKWDYVVLQGFSRELSYPESYIDSATVPYFEQLLDSIYLNNPCTKVLLYMTWGYKTGFQEREEVDSYNKMADAVKRGYQYLSKKYGLGIVAVGDVYQALSRFEDPTLFSCLYQKDEQHPTLFGSFTAASTFYTAIFRKSPRDSYHKGVSREDAELIQEMTYAIVDSSRKAYGLDRDYYDIDYSWTEKGNLVIQTRSNYGLADITWDFGDGNVIKQANVRHEYDKLKAYPITLAVHANCGNHSHTTVIPLNDLPKPDEGNPAASKIQRSIKKAKKQQRRSG